MGPLPLTQSCKDAIHVFAKVGFIIISEKRLLRTALTCRDFRRPYSQYGLELLTLELN